MTVKRLLALTLTVLLCVIAFAGCSNNPLSGLSDPATPGDSATETPAEPVTNDFNGFKAEKIGSFPDALTSNITDGTGMIYVNDNEMHGIITLDGKNDTGAKYTVCEAVENYFQVSTSSNASSDNPASLNCLGLVDAKGNEIIPMKYAAIDSLNERYAQVIEVTELTDDEDEALLYATSAMVSFAAAEGDPLFKGVWYIYDLTTGKQVPGATATNRYSISAYGEWIEFTTDEDEDVTVNANGDALPEDADLFNNGYYAVASGSEGTVYRGDQSKAFDFDSATGFEPLDSMGDYILASKYVDSASKYVLMDLDGNVVSAEFDSRPSVYGEMLLVNDTVVDLQGNNVLEGTFTSLYEEECFGGAWFARNDDDYVLFKADGTILFEGSEDEDLSVDPYTTFTITKKIADEQHAYCFQSKGFTVRGTGFAPWLIRGWNDDGTRNILDTMTGKTLIQGYSNYVYTAQPGVGIYVYAYKNGGTDIYLVK